MKFRWSVAPAQPALAAELATALKIPALLAQCLLNRGLTEPARVSGFLEPRLKQLADPFRLPNLAAAVERLFKAHKNNEPLVILGDYDVDGVTSTALLLQVFRGLGWTADSYLPRRMDEGYGLTREAIENCLRKFPTRLLLAVDCGSTATDSINFLRERRVDVIVLDHHQVSTPAPEPVALVNPRVHSGSEPEFGELCSVGLAFKLAHALVKRGRETALPGAAEFDLRPLLDLVALGTIADVVPLIGENRVLVSAGLERLNSTTRPGLVALKRAAQCPAALGAFEVSYQLAPRLNAAGRLETAEDSLKLLLADDHAVASSLATNLDACNRERQNLERGIVEEALALVRAKFKPDADFVIVEGRAAWHIGVVGIVASRILQHFYRPTLIVGGDGEEWRGSGRSIAGFDLAAALRECGDLLVRHGGHAMAAGLAIRPGKLDDFRVRLNEVARRALTPGALQPVLRLDGEVTLPEMTLDCVEQLERLKPVGQGNPVPQFFACQLRQQRAPQRMGANKQHVKMWVTDGRSTHEAVWWNVDAQAIPGDRFDLAFAPQVNEYNGRRSLQLKVLDWREPGGR